MRAIYVAVTLFAFAASASAQVPAGAPAGTTGVCKDGSYSDAASKRGACAGHKGVKDWYAADAAAAPKAPATAAASPAAAKPVAPPTAPAPATAASPSAAVVPASPQPAPKAPAAATPMAAGGGNGQVWVNSSSKVYHCQGTKYYGTTKAGSYMTEAAAIAGGNHGDHGKNCKAS